MENFKFKVYLGKDKETKERVYLTGFSWDCGWYYGGGYLSTISSHTHFDSVFINAKTKDNITTIWKDLSELLDDSQFDSNEWWRIKDLYKQFYSLKDTAEVFKCGGACTSENRNPEELNKDMAYKINLHIQDVIIPEIIKALKCKFQ